MGAKPKDQEVRGQASTTFLESPQSGITSGKEFWSKEDWSWKTGVIPVLVLFFSFWDPLF